MEPERQFAIGAVYVDAAIVVYGNNFHRDDRLIVLV
jgi:hypothetical protein